MKRILALSELEKLNNQIENKFEAVLDRLRKIKEKGGEQR